MYLKKNGLQVYWWSVPVLGFWGFVINTGIDKWECDARKVQVPVLRRMRLCCTELWEPNGLKGGGVLRLTNLWFLDFGLWKEVEVYMLSMV